jgi:hypothetical protein
MSQAYPTPSPGWRPVSTVLAGCYLLATAGCTESWWESPTSPQINTSSIFEPVDPSHVQVKAARLRSTPGGCEVDVTFTNVSDKTLSAGFDVDIVDAAGRVVASRSTAVLRAYAGETKTVSSEGTTAGPSGVRCPSNGRARVTNVGAYHF